MAEQLGLDEVVGNGGAIYLYTRAVRAGAVFMNPAGIGRFSRSRGTFDQDWREVACQAVVGLEYFFEEC